MIKFFLVLAIATSASVASAESNLMTAIGGQDAQSKALSAVEKEQAAKREASVRHMRELVAKQSQLLAARKKERESSISE